MSVATVADFETATAGEMPARFAAGTIVFLPNVDQRRREMRRRGRAASLRQWMAAMSVGGVAVVLVVVTLFSLIAR